MRPALRRTVVVLALLLIPSAAWFLIEGGAFLEHEDALDRSDAIFVLAGTRFERPLEAIDLYRAGYAPLILLSPSRAEPAEIAIRAKGIRFPRESELIRDAMVQLGVPASAILAPVGSVDNTAAEAQLLRNVALEHHWRRVVVVTSKYHTRRAGFAMRRALEGTNISIIMRASKHDPFEPGGWWHRRADFRDVTSEWQKLIAYRLGLAE